MPWPASGRDEDWRRSPQIDRLDPAAFAAGADLGTQGSPPEYLREASGGPLAELGAVATLVCDPGGVVGELSHPGSPGFDLAPALRQEGGPWRTLMGTVAAPGLRKLVALNTAQLVGGAAVYVPAGVTIARPVRVVLGGDRSGAAFPRVLVRLEAGSSLTLVEEWVSPDQDQALLCPVAEVELADGAHLTHVVVQRCGSETVVQSTARVRVGREARYDLRWAALGSAWQKGYFEVELAGQASEAKLVGLGLEQGRQHIDVQTLQDHLAPGAVSDLLYRAAVADRARSVYAGLIRVAVGAQKTNAYVQNRNLLLSPTAKADSNPTLEILANDVRCTHGSTAGRIDDDQLFYCQARGVPQDQARRLVVEGFFADVIDSFPEGAAREATRQWVLQGLARLAESGGLAGSPRAA
ncbi:MAG: Fe-S cluster assembly protein SufD [Candidatus Dormibacteria bacterium]